jgi:hypothetical protein
MMPAYSAQVTDFNNWFTRTDEFHINPDDHAAMTG